MRRKRTAERFLYLPALFDAFHLGRVRQQFLPSLKQPNLESTTSSSMG